MKINTAYRQSYFLSNHYFCFRDNTACWEPYSCKESLSYAFVPTNTYLFRINSSHTVQDFLTALNNIERSLELPLSEFEEGELDINVTDKFVIVKNDLWMKRSTPYFDMFCCIWKTLNSRNSLKRIISYRHIPCSPYFQPSRATLWALSQINNWKEIFGFEDKPKDNGLRSMFSNQYGPYTNGWTSKMNAAYNKIRDIKVQVDEFKTTLPNVRKAAISK